MILPIYCYGLPVLRKETEEIEPNYPNLAEIIQNMRETLTNSGGVGLAAPQVGLDIRLCIVDLDGMGEDVPEYKGLNRVYINGYIEEYGEETDEYDEGCLSIPGIYETVTRPTKIRVNYLDENFVEHDEWIGGFHARVIQHEFDHLDGELFIDKISAFRKQMIKTKLSKIQRGDVQASYRVKTAR